MVRYVKTIDELVDLIDRDFSGSNAVCPICKRGIGTVHIPNVELGLQELKFMQFKYPGIYCTEGHCIVSMEEESKPQNEGMNRPGNCRINIEDIGIKVFEVIKLVKPYLDIDETIPNAQLYWILMDKSKQVYTRGLSYEDALDLLEKLQNVGARAVII